MSVDEVSAPDVAANGAEPGTGADVGATPTDLVDLPLHQPGDRTTSRWQLPTGLQRLIGVVAVFAIWEFAAQIGWLSPQVLAGPSTVLTAGWDLVRNGILGEAMWASLQRVLWGLAIGVPVGAALALAAGLSKWADNLIDANVQMLRFVPIIALQPLLILWLGIGETPKIALIVLGVAFPIYINTYTSIRQLNPGYLELARVVELNRRTRVRKVILPAALPGFLTGLRMSTAIAWLLLVFAEQLNAQSGLGYLMIKAQTFFQSDVVVVCLVVYAVLGLISDGIVRFLDRTLLRWQPGR